MQLYIINYDGVHSTLATLTPEYAKRLGSNAMTFDDAKKYLIQYIRTQLDNWNEAADRVTALQPTDSFKPY